MEKMRAQRTREIARAVRQVELRTRRLVEGPLARRYRTAFRGGGVEVADTREYVRGDDPRRIDGNVTARTGVPHVRTVAETRGRELFLMIDVSSSGSHGSARSSKRQLAAEVASALAFSAIRNDDSVGLLLFTDRVERCVPPKRGRTHVLRILREILAFEATSHRFDLAAALDHANRVLRRRAVTVLVSDFLLVGPIDGQAAALQRKLKATARRHDVVAISVTDAREHQLPDLGVITLEDAESGEQIEIDTSSERTREAHRRAADRYHTEIARCIRASGVDHLALTTTAPLGPALAAFLGGQRQRAR